jgi:tetratricopeptide (TPR) repeat protein
MSPGQSAGNESPGARTTPLLLRLILIGISLFLLVRAVQRMQRPAYESHITGDDAARAGIAMVHDGDAKQGVETLERALRKPMLEVNLAEIYAALGEGYTALGHEPGAEEKRFLGVLCTAIAHRMRDELDPALAGYKSAAQMRPDSAKPYEGIGSVLLAQGKNAEAATALERALGLDGTVAVTHANLALAYIRLGRFSDAEGQIGAAEKLRYDKVAQLRELLAQAQSARPAP